MAQANSSTPVSEAQVLTVLTEMQNLGGKTNDILEAIKNRISRSVPLLRQALDAIERSRANEQRLNDARIDLQRILTSTQDAKTNQTDNVKRIMDYLADTSNDPSDLADATQALTTAIGTLSPVSVIPTPQAVLPSDQGSASGTPQQVPPSGQQILTRQPVNRSGIGRIPQQQPSMFSPTRNLNSTPDPPGMGGGYKYKKKSSRSYSAKRSSRKRSSKGKKNNSRRSTK